MADTPDVNAVVTVESGGRTLSGAGVSAEQLQETIDSHEERHAPAGKTAGEESTAPAASAPSGSATDAIAPKQTRGQARFSELTQARKDAEAKAEAAERKAAELEARLSQQSPPPREPDRPRDSPQPHPPQPTYTRPEPSEDDIGDKYATYAAFTKDQALWVWEQQQAQFDFQGQIRQHLEQERTRQTFDTHVEAVRAKGRAAYKDWDSLMANGPGTFIDMPVAAVQAIVSHPQSEHLQHAIMASAEIAQKLAGLAFQNPFGFGIELERLVPAQAPSNGHRPVASPPPPMQPVGSGSRSSTPTSAEHAEKGDYQAYKAARAAERRGNSR